MSEVFIRSSAFILFWFTVASLPAQTSVLLPSAHDVSLGYHDNYNSENTNYNSSIHCSGFSTAGTMGGINKGRGLMDFDLSGIPSGSTILGAFLNLTAIGPWGIGPVGSVGSVGQNSCTIRRVTASWNDGTVTWNTQPPTTMQNATALPQSTYPLQNYYSIDVTALVLDMVADPSNSFGFMLVLDDETPERGLVFHSGLADHADQRPTLLVLYGECGATNVLEDPVHPTIGLRILPNIGTPGELMTLNMPGPSLPPCRLEVSDTVGRMVWSGQVRQWPVAWTVPALGQGTYTVVAKDRDGHPLGTARVVVR